MIRPEGTKVVVIPDQTEEITKGGIYVPDTVRENQQQAVTRGTLYALGPLADVYFSDDEDGIEKHKAKPGDRVMYVKYAGANLKRREGNKYVEYRILQDQDIVCFYTDEESDMPDTRKPMVK